MVNGFFRYAKRDRLFGRRRNMREDPTIRSRKGGRAAKAVLRIQRLPWINGLGKGRVDREQRGGAVQHRQVFRQPQGAFLRQGGGSGIGQPGVKPVQHVGGLHLGHRVVVGLVQLHPQPGTRQRDRRDDGCDPFRFVGHPRKHGHEQIQQPHR